MLPNFICVRAQKVGTPPLFRVLEQHRDVSMPLRRLYREAFKDEIGRLEELLGRDLANWRQD